MSRVLIFLFDGTANDPTEINNFPTNIFMMNQLIAESRNANGSSNSQITFYSPGIGTQFYATGFIAKFVQRTLVNDSLYNMILRAYVNLSSNYRPGDEIVILGFSRGAIAAKMFSRIISDFGLLKAIAVHRISEIINEFSAAIFGTLNDYKLKADSFKERMSRYLHDVQCIKFLGLFDCVGGNDDDEEIRNFLHTIDESVSSSVSNYYHIMALHDVRSHFKLWRTHVPKEVGCEIWMPGVHSDVGGGYENRDVANISLLAMIDRLSSQAQIAFEAAEIETLVNTIKLQTGNPTFIYKVNREYPVVIKMDRSNLFRDDDIVHRFHKWLLGREVFWKNECRVIYENRINLREADRTMAGHLDQILN